MEYPYRLQGEAMDFVRAFRGCLRETLIEELRSFYFFTSSYDLCFSIPEGFYVFFFFLSFVYWLMFETVHYFLFHNYVFFVSLRRNYCDCSLIFEMKHS